MSAPGRMHDDEIDVAEALVARLVDEQFPDWEGMPVRRVPSAGTDNALFRLGSDLLARFPLRPGSAAMVEKELRWLPRIAPLLPVAVPTPFAAGAPTADYPYVWSVCAWIEGEDATRAAIADRRGTVDLLGRFVASMQSVTLPGGPGPGVHNSWRGEPLATRDDDVRAALAELAGELDVRAASASWSESLAAPQWAEEPVWLHGDLHAGNLLVRHGRLFAVLDFGCLGVGDPACDAMVGWMFLEADERSVFREMVAFDDATWVRGRGWALSMGLIALPYYRDTNPVLAGISRQAIAAVLADREA